MGTRTSNYTPPLNCLIHSAGNNLTERIYDASGILPTIRRSHPPMIRLPDGSLRWLSPLEGERAQGFPDGWTNIPWSGNSGNNYGNNYRYRLRAIGNSFPVPVCRWIGERIEAIHKAAIHE